MKLSDFKYDLPSDLIAQYPQDKRDQSRAADNQDRE